MILKITDNKTISDIKMKFAECFPYLKIEMYYRSHKWNESTRADFLVPPDRKIGDVRRTHNQGILEIKSWDKTGEVEKLFKDRFDLNVQVFRRYKSGWVQTTKTDDLTLLEQTELAAKEVGRICIPD